MVNCEVLIVTFPAAPALLVVLKIALLVSEIESFALTTTSPASARLDVAVLIVKSDKEIEPASLSIVAFPPLPVARGSEEVERRPLVRETACLQFIDTSPAFPAPVENALRLVFIKSTNSASIWIEPLAPSLD